MGPVTITCEICGQPAIVHRVSYNYVGDGEIFQIPPENRSLRDVQREIECPRCGRRTQTEKPHGA